MSDYNTITDSKPCIRDLQQVDCGGFVPSFDLQSGQPLWLAEMDMYSLADDIFLYIGGLIREAEWGLDNGGRIW